MLCHFCIEKGQRWLVRAGKVLGNSKKRVKHKTEQVRAFFFSYLVVLDNVYFYPYIVALDSMYNQSYNGTN